MSADRLKNEYTASKLVAERTTIPVPKPLRLEYIEGCLAMTSELVDGVPFSSLAPHIRSLLYLDDYVQTFVLPQLKLLKSHTYGTIDGAVLPPRRVFDNYPGRQWFPRKSKEEEYHFTHNDLSQHNFLCDRHTGEVIAVIDWEFAGFYPGYFEAPLWRASYDEIEDDEDEIGQLLHFLESPNTSHTTRCVNNYQYSPTPTNNCWIRAGTSGFTTTCGTSRVLA
ncbi:hypothetical protein HRR83_000903 [Exophiala dermatitidis]|uniref:Aminoglycoside phosphotransferase domain-containing protein n=1 Tax=Exophiala dermatitidis TaxID=5970 RepID=A0AAN6F624_EXODE|nr:hypothetical protein HRR75_000817 [Exophiala dermatitidis]KAJ4528152.1 hypothetical protein HRR74_000907 [Exophiala dermatitidis]KAJ4528785.1 hypothetical protein HRR73_001408 [Exophiala dermatitidis]KAJ4530170.1 hypothetical protein HRR76_009404 [Exophiala dermatitidis]KAJ4553113.1 hypothetical protein HRR78_003372 [Exophiala dermatitidis]